MKNLSKKEFEHAMRRLREGKKMLSQHPDKEECIQYLMKETGLPKETCERAYAFYWNLDIEF